MCFRCSYVTNILYFSIIQNGRNTFIFFVCLFYKGYVSAMISTYFVEFHVPSSGKINCVVVKVLEYMSAKSSILEMILSIFLNDMDCLLQDFETSKTKSILIPC